MTNAQTRLYVANLYPGRNWKRRVERMPDDQVAAIFLKHQREGKIDEPEHDPQEHFDVPGQGPHSHEDDFLTY